MAEGFGKEYLPEWNVYSAGIESHGVNPKAIEAMKEVGIDISNHTSDVIDKDILNNADLVVTLCDHAKMYVRLHHHMYVLSIGDLKILLDKTGQYFSEYVMKLEHVSNTLLKQVNKMELPKISKPALRALGSINVKTLEDVMKYSEAELLALHGFGPKAIRILKEVMEEQGLKFKEE